GFGLAGPTQFVTDVLDALVDGGLLTNMGDVSTEDAEVAPA
ncbi:hypothetical protein A2U01_0080181, partial [Trifolium medium]|nr:hypothetical protein [Trifolium medium]